ncbi:MAG: CehA/McbA family metallohydrolase [Deltaproteobacteria bacterium]|nr:CehA/McbA family metallohydrolase [Deltaproteobacteria bacterium]
MARRIAIWSLWLLAGLGCDGSQSTSPDSGTPRLPLDERLLAGQVRAGVIELESELLSGSEAHGWIGDFKLYNDKVAFVVQNPIEPRGWGPYGGSLLDADRIRPPGSPGTEIFQEMIPYVELLSVEPESGEVVADGRDGGPALVRLVGRHRGIPLLDAALGGALAPKDLEISLEYELAASSEFLVARTRIRSLDGSEPELDVGDVLLDGDLSTGFAKGPGEFGEDVPAGELDYLASYGPVYSVTGPELEDPAAAICYLYTSMQGGVQAIFSREGITPLVVESGKVDGELVVERLLAVGDGGLDACLRILRTARGDSSEMGEIAGTVSSGPEPLAGASILVHDLAMTAGRDAVSQAFTNEQGAFSFELAPGDYRLELRANAREAVLSRDVSLAAGASERVDLEAPQPGRVVFACSEQDLDGAALGPMPCKLSLQAGLAAARTASVPDGRLAFALSSQGELLVPAGEWTATLSRGWEYAIFRQDVSLEPGQTVELEAALRRQVDTSGWLAVDPHNHSTRSVDSDYLMSDKLGSNLAEGVELLIVTDHDCQADLSPSLQAMSVASGTDLGRFLRVVVGDEVSALYGHFTVFPLPTHPSGWIYWQIPWTIYEDGKFVRQRVFAESFALARELGAEVVNAAHPITHQGWLSTFGVDPPETIPTLAELEVMEGFTTDFDTIELLNGDDTSTMLYKMIPLWSSFCMQGLFRTGTGVSDSHGRGGEAGFGRTMVAVSDDRPDRVDLSEVWQSLRAGRAQVGGGIFVLLSVDGHGPGELASVSSPFEVRLRVEAADWVEAEQVELLVAGALHTALPLAEAGELDPARPGLRLDETIEVEAGTDTWLAAVAYGPAGARLDPVFRGCRPVGFANALKVDLDGDGQYAP